MVQELRKRRDELKKNKFNNEKENENLASSENLADEIIKPYVELKFFYCIFYQ